MKDRMSPPVDFFPLPEERGRAFSYSQAVENELEPREYESLVDAEPMSIEALLDFKVWGKTPCLSCYFRDIRTDRKFRLTAFNNARDRRYTPRDGNIDFSEPGIEGGLYHVITVKTRNGKSAWQSAQRLLPPEQKEEIAARIVEAHCTRSSSEIPL